MTRTQRVKNFISDTWYAISWAVGLLAAIAAVMGVICWGTAAAMSVGCERQLDAIGRDGHYDFWASSCFVELDDGRRIDIDSLRVDVNGQIEPR